MVDYNAEKSADIISRVRADDAQWPAGAMLFGPSGGKEIVIDREFEDDVFVARCNDVADAARLCRSRDAARDLADQLEAAGVEIERLKTEAVSWEATCDIYSAASTATHIALGGEMGEELVQAAERVRQQLETMKNERDRAGAASRAAQRKCAALNEAIAELADVRLGQRASIAAARAALRCGDGELMVEAALRVHALAEQRLEDLAAEQRNRVTSEMEAAETLAMAQRRIADLETRVATGEEDIAHLTKVRRETHMILTENKVDGLEVRATARARMAEFAAALQKLATSEHVVMRLRQHDERQAARISSLDGELEAKTSELAGLSQQLAAAEAANVELRACVVKQDAAAPTRDEVNRVARLLIAEWERVERAAVNVSYISTFADMARVVIADKADDYVRLLAQCEGQKTDLAAAQQRIAELEADAKAQDERWAGTLDSTFAVGDGTAQAEIERCRARVIELEAGLANSLEHEDKLEKRIRELETTTVAAMTSYAASLEATLRAIAPVFQAAGSALGNLRHGPGGRGGPGECDAGCVKCSVSTARAALTPELLGVLGRVTSVPR